ncbi:hypothetical protein [Fimbriimonas ginsengisoli]|uniref:ABM domain-containing protein n=1 Tax=Fimbriimonas ginsengisoli Gsoil 348 TaxID=661478 RepID=A0A068NJL3_FIMGI|nr:hypothetical protein [Fimbriimonas ginsengisoli]AIE83637.1 hypothetical protein OP10G_0269 [Fimbriimonas ginsengisoli Gsoil 348]
MSEILVLIRVRINELDASGVEDYFLACRARLETVDGSFGHSLWRNTIDHEQLLVAFEYRDLQAAERGLQALAGIRLLAESQSADYHPADVLRVQVQGRSGLRIFESPKPGYLSMSVRVADPGRAQDLLDEIGAIFQGLEFIKGCCGSVFGNSDKLEEEVIGIVTWKTVVAFASSLPPGDAPYEIVLYERVY